MAEAFIKLHRKMLEWEWYDDPNTKVVFIHCLLRANWKAAKWHGIEIEPGQFITSLPSLAEETKLSVMQVRSALKKLTSTGEITSKQQARCRIITVNNWHTYQGDNRMITGSQQDDNRLVTADKEYKNNKNKKNKKIHNFCERDYDFDELEKAALGRSEQM